MRSDEGAEQAGVFQNFPGLGPTRQSDHEAGHERVAGADRVFHFDMRRGRSR